MTSTCSVRTSRRESLLRPTRSRRCASNAPGPCVVCEAPTFRRVEVTDKVDTVLVDFAIDMPPIRAVNLTAVGPTFEPTELGARKLLALFDRAAARDFADLCTLGARFDLSDLLALARDLDGGFDTAIFVEMLETVRRFSDEELAATGSDPATVRQFAADLADRLR